MLTKNKIKFIRSLASKRERYSHRNFIIEGEKGIEEALNSDFEIEEIFGLESYENSYAIDLFTKAKKNELERMSSLSTAPGVIALMRFKDWGSFEPTKGKFIMLDSLNDPGNLGTIIRIADWYGIDGIICSKDSVDVYNSKVVQSSMGSVLRIPVWYEDLKEILKTSSLDNYGALMEGKDFKKVKFAENSILILGSESHGISEELIPFVKNQITIPRKGRAESLNVSVAAGILCQQWIN